MGCLLILLAGLGGCAAQESLRPGLPPASVQVQVAGQLPQPHRSPSPLVQSGLALDAGAGLLRYEAGYALQPSAWFGTDARLSPQTLPAQLGQQSLSQELGWRLPAVAGAPLEVDMRYRQRGDWVETGLVQSEARRAMDLRWAPGFAQFDLQWSGVGAAHGPLTCPVEGGVRLPLPTEARLNLRGRDCQLVIPDLAVEDPAAARSWSAALEWGRRGAAETAFRLTSIVPEVPLAGQDGLLRDAYELGVMRRLPYRGWEAQAAVNWRAVPGLELERPWSADASLRRELAGIDLSARLRTGVDPYWFMPSVLETRNQYQLGLDLSRWVSQRLPGEQTRMGLAYQLDTYPDRPAAAAYENSVRWDFSLRW